MKKLFAFCFGVFLIGVLFSNNASGDTRNCELQKLCFFEDDFIEYIIYTPEGQPSLQIKYTHAGTEGGSKITVKENLIQLKSGAFFGEQLPNGTIKWVTEAEQYESIGESYPFYSAFHYLMFPYPVNLDFLKMNVQEDVYDFNGMNRNVIVAAGKEEKIIVDKETGIVLFGRFGYYGYQNYQLQDTNIISKNAIKIEENNKNSSDVDTAWIDPDTGLFQTPYKMVKYGIEPEWVVCNGSFVKLYKPHQDVPVCVKPSTSDKLIERGWRVVIN